MTAYEGSISMAPALKVTKLTIALNFLAIYLIWGSTYLAIRFGVETLPPYLMAGVRFLIGGALFYGWARMRGAEKPQKKLWAPMAVIGVLLLLGGNGLVTWAEKIVPSGLTALIIATVPLWIVLFDWLSPKGSRPGPIVIAGLVLGFVGIGALIDPTNVSGVEEIDLFGAFVILLATVFWAAGSIYSRHTPMPSSKTLGIGMQMLAGGVALLIVSALAGETTEFSLAQVSAKSSLALLYLITLGSVGFGAYIWLLQHVKPAKVATYAYVNPIIALALGNLLADEPLSAWTLGSSAVVILAVFMIVTAKAAKESPTDNSQSLSEESTDTGVAPCETPGARLACGGESHD